MEAPTLKTMNIHYFFNKALPQVGAVPVRVINSWSVHCTCPGSDLHTTPTAMNHTTAFWNGGRPWINCYHTSCREVVLAVNLTLRKQSHSTSVSRSSRNRTAPGAPLDPRWELRDLARLHKEAILDRYHWPLAKIEQESPYDVNEVPAIQTLLHLSLFEPQDVIWIGELNHTGRPWSVKNFQYRDDWLPKVDKLSPFICPAVFNPGTYSRANRNIAVRKFLVVESDTLSKDQAGAVFRLLSQRLILRAVVDSGGKSLHGWFDCPDLRTTG